jgi:hypothetical protein
MYMNITCCLNYWSNSHSLYTLVIENTLFKIVDYLLITNFLKQLILKNWKFWNAFLLYVWRLIFPFCFMIITLFFFLKENHLMYKTVGYHTFAFYFLSFFRVIATCTRYLVKATNHDIMYISHIIFWRIVTVWLYLYHLCWKSCHNFFCELHHFFLITMENRIKIFLEVLFVLILHVILFYKKK